MVNVWRLFPYREWVASSGLDKYARAHKLPIDFQRRHVLGAFVQQYLDEFEHMGGKIAKMDSRRTRTQNHRWMLTKTTSRDFTGTYASVLPRDDLEFIKRICWPLPGAHYNGNCCKHQIIG